MKLSYQKSKNKIEAREKIFSGFSFKKIVGLGGPDIGNYINNVSHKGFEEISIYEMNRHIMLVQMRQLKINTVKINWFFGDIIQAPVFNDVLYDLDFCCHIETVQNHIKKYRDNFIITISERGKIKFSSIQLFVQYRQEQLLYTYVIDNNQRLIVTDKSSYLISAYFDTSAMLIINQIKS